MLGRVLTCASAWAVAGSFSYNVFGLIWIVSYRGEEVGVLVGVTVSMSRPMAAHSPLTVRSAALRSSALSFENATSS